MDNECFSQAQDIIGLMNAYKNRVDAEHHVNEDKDYMSKIIDFIQKHEGSKFFHRVFLICSKKLHPDKNVERLIDATSDIQNLKNATEYLSKNCLDAAKKLKYVILTAFKKMIGEGEKEEQSEIDNAATVDAPPQQETSFGEPPPQETSFSEPSRRETSFGAPRQQERPFYVPPIFKEGPITRTNVSDLDSKEYYDEQAKKINAINAGLKFASGSQLKIAVFIVEYLNILKYDNKYDKENVFSSAVANFEILNPRLTVGLKDNLAEGLDLENLTAKDILDNFKVQLKCDEIFLAPVTSNQVKRSHENLKNNAELRKIVMSINHPSKINRSASYNPGSLGNNVSKRPMSLNLKNIKQDRGLDGLDQEWTLGPKMGGGSKTRKKRKQKQTKRKQRRGRKTRRK
jgi:hypothetical protein